jgi:hypothetical protein
MKGHGWLAIDTCGERGQDEISTALLGPVCQFTVTIRFLSSTRTILGACFLISSSP